MAHAEVERERTRELARVGNNLNQIARWANTHKGAVEADTLPFEHKYTSGVIAWAPEDEPTDEQIGAVLDAFEETAWAGLEFDRYGWTASDARPPARRLQRRTRLEPAG